MTIKLMLIRPSTIFMFLTTSYFWAFIFLTSCQHFVEFISVSSINNFFILLPEYQTSCLTLSIVLTLSQFFVCLFILFYLFSDSSTSLQYQRTTWCYSWIFLSYIQSSGCLIQSCSFKYNLCIDYSKTYISTFSSSVDSIFIYLTTYLISKFTRILILNILKMCFWYSSNLSFSHYLSKWQPYSSSSSEWKPWSHPWHLSFVFLHI